jgi:hypothetical protein
MDPWDDIARQAKKWCSTFKGIHQAAASTARRGRRLPGLAPALCTTPARSGFLNVGSNRSLRITHYSTNSHHACSGVCIEGGA